MPNIQGDFPTQRELQSRRINQDGRMPGRIGWPIQHFPDGGMPDAKVF
jgi:hypothetical protein